MRTVTWFDTSMYMKLQRDYNGRTDVDDIQPSFLFTDGSNKIMITGGKDCEAVKTFDSPDVGEHTVYVKLTLIGETAKKYKIKEGGDEFTIGGTITKAYAELTVSLVKSKWVDW